MVWSFAVLVVAIGTTTPAQDDRAGSPKARKAEPQRLVTIEIFVRPDTERSQEALKVLQELEQQRPGIRIEVQDVVNDPSANERFWKLARNHRIEKPVVPAFQALNRFLVGFRDGKTAREKLNEFLTLDAFVREGCPHCRDAKAFLSGLQERWPGIQVRLSDVVKDSGQSRRMHDLAKQNGVTVVSLPCFYFCGRFMVGYQDDQTTGRQIEQLLEEAQPPKKASGTSSSHFRWSSGTEPRRFPADFDRPRITFVSFQQQVPLPIPDEDVGDAAPPPPEDDAGLREAASSPHQPPEGIDVPLFGKLKVRELGLPCFTIAIGLIDGFNPCAMWVLIFLLSILVNIRDRKKIVAIAGTFVVISGLAYFAFMAAWLNMFLLIGFARPAQIALGLVATIIGAVNVKDFVAFRKGITFSIPESAKPGIYARMRNLVQTKYLSVALFGAATLAVFVNVVEILCTAGLPALYTQILTYHELPAWKNYAYLALYNVTYMFDDSIMLVIAVVTLSHRKLQEREGRWLKLISGLVILLLGLAMLFKPDWLS
jgi:glutaredoxin